jgi:pSer/pThr/pTyr-binding forkhead associated (FHA) protein
VVPDRGVARKHVGIRRHTASRMRYELADLGSIHGVSVNGQRMAKRVLASGDIIRLGTSEMVFRIEKVG